MKLVKVRRVEASVKKDELREAISVKAVKLENLTEEAERFQERCYDVRTGIEPEMFRTGNVANGLMFNNEVTDTTASFNDFAFSQFCSKLDLPCKYLKKCLENNELGLFNDNIMTWVEKYHGDLIFRCYSDKVTDKIRGVLSTRFSRFDLPDILHSIEGIKDFDEKYKIRGYMMNPERFHMRWTFREPFKDDLYLGAELDSSDVGRSNLRFGLILYKQVCTNGLVIPKKVVADFKRKHIGITAEDFKLDFQDKVSKISDISDTVLKYIESSKDRNLNHYVDFTDKEKFIKWGKNRIGLTEKFTTDIFSAINNDRVFEPTVWGFTNAMTEFAQRMELEHRLEIERKAGEFLFSV